METALLQPISPAFNIPISFQLTSPMSSFNKCRGINPEFEWRVADVGNLEVCDDASIDVAIDKVRVVIRMVKPPNDGLSTRVGNHGLYGVRVSVGPS